MNKLWWIILILMLFPAALFADIDTSSLNREEQKTLYKAQKAIKNNEFKEAREIIFNYLEKQLNQPNALLYYVLGNAWYLDEHFQKAYNIYAKAYQLMPDSFSICINFAKVSYEIENYSKAAELFKKAYKLSNPVDPELLYQAGVAFYQTNDFAKARSVLKQLLDSNKKIKKSWLQLFVHICLELKQWNEAKSFLENFLNHNSMDDEYWKLLAQIQLKTKDYRSAASSLEIAYAIKTASSKELEELANMYFHLNAPLKAISTLKKAYGPHPNVQHSEKLFRACVQAQQPADAIRYLDLAIQQKASPKFFLEKGKIYYEQGKWDKAIKALQKSIQMNPNQELAYLLLGYCALEKEDFILAQKALSKASKGKHYHNQAISLLKMVEQSRVEFYPTD
ncbi:Tetratricopeptide repeat-containing protein [Candidatus Magnetomoraceae bacterium gMMP-15]